MFSNLTGWHALIILAIILLLFGATKLPALAKSVGQSMKAFQKEVGRKDDAAGIDPAEDGTDAETVSVTPGSERSAA